MARPPKDKSEVQERLRREQEAFDQEIAALRARRAEKLREIQDEIARIDAREREAKRKVHQRMAFVIGEFLLREGPDAELVQTITGSPAFEAFTRGPRYRGARPFFGLSELAPPAADPTAKPPADGAPAPEGAPAALLAGAAR
jgi:hypothetical protein